MIFLNTYRHYQNRRTTTQAITTTQAPQTNTFQSDNVEQPNTQTRVMGLVNNLSVEELKELMILLMDIDLDQTKSSNVTWCYKRSKTTINEQLRSSQQEVDQLANHQMKSVAQN